MVLDSFINIFIVCLSLYDSLLCIYCMNDQTCHINLNLSGGNICTYIKPYDTVSGIVVICGAFVNVFLFLSY